MADSRPRRRPGRPPSRWSPSGCPTGWPRGSSDQIERGRLRPGDRLPTEPQLAATHGVSRTVVREAVHQVKSRGLVRARQGSGVFVAAAPARAGLRPDRCWSRSTPWCRCVELRRVLEGEMAALAAQRATPRSRCGAASRVAGDRAVTRRRRARRRRGFRVSPRHRRGHRQPAVRAPADFIEQYLLDAMRVTKGNEARRRRVAGPGARSSTTRSRGHRAAQRHGARGAPRSSITSAARSAWPTAA